MHAYEIADKRDGGRRGAGPSRAEVERRGRWGAYHTAVSATLLLWAAQLPARQVAQGRWATAVPFGPVVPARIALVLDLCMIISYLTVAYRGVELVRSSRAPRIFRQVAAAGMAAVGTGAVLDAIEDVVLWFRVADATGVADLRLPVTAVLVPMVLAGLGVVSAAAVLSSPGLWWRRSGDTVVPLGWRSRAWPRRAARWLAGHSSAGHSSAGRASVGSSSVGRASVGSSAAGSSSAGNSAVGRSADRGSAAGWWLARRLPVGRWLSGRRVRGLLDPHLGCAVERWRGTLVARSGQPGPAEKTAGGTIICCSGGGIRSASFCLGGLQTLMEKGKYQAAEAVIGVSGGGYVAAAYHVARWKSAAGPDRSPWPAGLQPPVFAPESPELRWLRRNTRYLFGTPRVAVLGVLSLLFGIAVNLILLAAVLGGAAWWLGWLLAASGGISGWHTAAARAGGYTGDWAWLAWVWWVPLVGIGLFVLEKAVDRYVTVPFGVREGWRRASFVLVLGGTAVVALFLGLPHLLEALHDYGATNGSLPARLVYELGLVPTEVCTRRLLADAYACGLTPETGLGQDNGLTTTPLGTEQISGGSLVTIVAAVLAAVRAAWSTVSSDKTFGTGIRGMLGKAWSRVKEYLLPWTAAVVICLVAVGLVTRWIAVFLARPALLDNWGLVYLFAGLLLAVKLGTDANRTSLHHFYRERLSHAFLVRRRGSLIEPVAYGAPLRFSQAGPPKADDGRRAGPRLVSCAVANVGDPELVPSDRDCTPFVFDDVAIGLTDDLLPAGQAMAASGMYEFVADPRYRDATIPAAMAISGAAVSPLAGRQNVRVGPYRLLLALANARLGVWLPNPLWIDDPTTVRRMIKLGSKDTIAGWERLPAVDRKMLYHDLLNDADRRWLHARVPDMAGQREFKPPPPGDDTRRDAWRYRLAAYARIVLNKPGLFRVAREALGKTSYFDRLLYVTDGGHYDNLGLVEALRRRPREVIVLDASSDPEDSFQTLGQAIATARMDLDCEIDFDPRKMRKLDKERSVAAWGRGTVKYRDSDVTTSLLLAKVILVEGLPWDLETYSASNPQFPRTSTGKQLYGEFDLEAYRVLGREVTRRLIEDPAPEPEAGTHISVDTVTVNTLHLGGSRRPRPARRSWTGVPVKEHHAEPAAPRRSRNAAPIKD